MALMNEDLTPSTQAGIYEHRAGELLSIAGPTPRAVAEAHALATLASSLRLRGIEESVDLLRSEGIWCRS